MSDANTPATLAARLVGAETDPDTLLEIFLSWCADVGLTLYDAQEEAILEVFAGAHVVLNTPTGSGKSLVALAMHFFSFATGRRSYYTSPIKALVSEKFFHLCGQFGAENVGMLTGDASINPAAPIVCCTAEILAATALSEGPEARVDHAILDEFHYYADRDRGMAWQLPLLLLTDTTFMPMSATLGDPTTLAQRIEKRTGRPVAVVRSDERPVPLAFSYSTEPLIATIVGLVEGRRAPVYVVNFSQRECGELAQSLTSTNFCTKEEKLAIRASFQGFKFDTPYGKVVRRYLEMGLAVHHAGLLPKYRLLVERLAQEGHLRVICGTDTLGVGINLPIRSVLFTKLCKFDGEKVRLLRVRDFKQIAGRAGRKGYDDEGLVLCQAPAHVIENMRLAARATDGKKRRKIVRKKAPDRGYVHWDEGTFTRLQNSNSEELTSRFQVTHGMLVNLLQRSAGGCGYRALIDLFGLSHERDAVKSRLRKKARWVFQSLREANIVEVVPRDTTSEKARVRLTEGLQRDFSIYHSLSLFLVHVAERLDPDDPNHHLKVLAFVEAILENPMVVLVRQKEKHRSAAYAAMKAEGIEYDERQEKLEEITWPMPDMDLVLGMFEAYAATRPWLAGRELRPKSVVGDMYERYATFNEYVGEYGLERAEGVLLRYLSQTYKTLRQNVPDEVKTEDLHELEAYLRQVLRQTDSSLVQAWEQLKTGVSDGAEEVIDRSGRLLDADLKAFRAQVRAQLRLLVGALARRDYDEAAAALRPGGDTLWTPVALERAMAPYYDEYQHVVFDHAARSAQLVQMVRHSPGAWRVTQVICDPEEHNEWFLDVVVDVSNPEGDYELLLTLERVGDGVAGATPCGRPDANVLT